MLPGPNELVVWRIPLDGPADANESSSFLTQDERDRAEHFRIDSVRRRFIRARAAVRAILGRLLNLPPHRVTIEIAEHGKPHLAREHRGTSPIEFNLSHSGELALLGLTHGMPLGIDVERLRSNLDCLKLARRFFSATESAQLEEAPDDRLARRFFRIWTAKEAYLKGLGSGLQIPLDQFSVRLLPGDLVDLESTEHAPGESRHWSLGPVNCGAGFIGTYAAKGSVSRIQYRDLPPDIGT